MGQRRWLLLNALAAAKENAAQGAAFSGSSEVTAYFEIERLNMRSIFSLVASQHDWLACAAASAWFAVLCAPLAVEEADWAAEEAASAELLAPATSDESRPTCAFRSSTCACSGLRSVQPTSMTTAAAAATLTIALFIEVPFMWIQKPVSAER